MYDQRVKVFIGFCVALLLACVLRLAQIQLLTGSDVQGEIAKLTERRQSKQLKTLRGRILDRNGNVLAADTPKFQVYVNYALTCYLDERVVLAKMLDAKRENSRVSPEQAADEVKKKLEQLNRVIEECAQFGIAREETESTIQIRNDRIWNRRSHVCWVHSECDPNLVARYGSRSKVPFLLAMKDLERQFPDPNERYREIARVDNIPEVEWDLAVATLQADDDVFAAQVEFRDIPDVKVLPTGYRYYPYGSAAAQTIGWVGPAQDRDKKLFEDDPLSSYRDDEVCGKEDGVEYVCESILRGRRGEMVYDIDRQLVRETETQFGRDVQLTLDIELQKRIEGTMTDPNINPEYCRAPMAAVVIDVGTGDILALASLPTYDLNTARRDWGRLLNDKERRPLINRTINDRFPPGSVVKPLILIAGLESGVVTPEEPISCPSRAQSKPPNCLIFKTSGIGHDEKWTNNARNALRGSCNVYFAELADRIELRRLQEWMFRFGYGHEIPLTCPIPPDPGVAPRSFRQVPGQISTRASNVAEPTSFDQIPPLSIMQRRLFGIGHGAFVVTPLQVANTFATLARGGQQKTPRLFLNPAPPAAELEDLHISMTSLATAAEGMHAVVSETGGSAHAYFLGSDLYTRGVTVYGKTGSTEAPEVAWFAGYAEDAKGVKIAIAVVVVGGERGGSDAAPLGRAILELCAAAGYLGN
ncbi:MAG: peptidoglycan D,D-transpeptidase FtsI family protein [Solirubrobacterales bacterium]